MPFKIIKPSPTNLDSNYFDDKVRVGFPMSDNIPQLLIYIGQDIAKKFGLKKGDRVVLLVDEDKDLWQIKKDNEGYKLAQAGTSLKLQMSWRENIPKNFGKSMQFVKTGDGDGNLQLDVSKPL